MPLPPLLCSISSPSPPALSLAWPLTDHLDCLGPPRPFPTQPPEIASNHPLLKTAGGSNCLLNMQLS